MNNCTCNQPPNCTTNDCSCPIKDLSTDCVLYTGDDLPCSGIKKNTIITELIQQLDTFVCTLMQQTVVTPTYFNNTTLTPLSELYLNTNYPTAVTGDKVYCLSITSGERIYEKSLTGWVSYGVSVV